ncbi:MAG: hypothetical protein M0R46_11265 [Candidatus Muirbacterium halophilum]|nr:hypothetical protein [Candidatus Muirbacterium halophilum]MCK9476492.1 hypothetical protein [Candidatus Muirbacterium halophilum]
MFKCNCGYETTEKPNFCPICGLKFNTNQTQICANIIKEQNFTEHTSQIFDLFFKNIIPFILISCTSYIISFIKGISGLFEAFIISFIYPSFCYFILENKLKQNENNADFFKEQLFKKYNYTGFFILKLSLIGIKYALLLVFGIISAIIIYTTQNANSMLSDGLVKGILSLIIIWTIYFLLYSLIAIIADFAIYDQIIKQTPKITHSIKKVTKKLFKNINQLTIYYLKMSIVFIPLFLIAAAISSLFLISNISNFTSIFSSLTNLNDPTEILNKLMPVSNTQSMWKIFGKMFFTYSMITLTFSLIIRPFYYLYNTFIYLKYFRE